MRNLFRLDDERPIAGRRVVQALFKITANQIRILPDRRAVTLDQDTKLILHMRPPEDCLANYVSQRDLICMNI
jgi:hypothetical protein